MTKILIGVSGSIAAYKVPGLVHELKKSGYEIQVVLTQNALQFVTPLTFASLGAIVYTDNLFSTDNLASVMQHINLARWPDLILLIPATANIIAKVANGFADSLLTSTILASPAPVFIVPAMNKYMWSNWVTQENINKLIANKIQFWGPVSGLQACGDEGEGRMLEPSDIINKIKQLGVTKNKLAKGLLTNKKIIITAGPTREEIDPVRFLSNNSSGKMGYALAKACWAEGANVTVISGPVNLEQNLDINYKNVISSEEMLVQAYEHSLDADIFIGAAAVCDYKIQNISKQKIKKNQINTFNLELKNNIDIIKSIKMKYPAIYAVGFAAETENLVEFAKSKLKDKNLNLIIANEVGFDKAFNSDYNEVLVINNNQSIPIKYALKEEVAIGIVKIIASDVNNKV